MRRASLRLEPLVSPTGFRFEKDLVAVVRDSSVLMALNILDATHRVINQMQIGMRIPDLLVVAAKENQELAPLRLTYFECAIIATTIQSGQTTVANLAAHTYAPAKDVAKRVNRLIRLGLIASNAGSDQLRVARALPAGLRIIAVEAKLSRWKDALNQAKHYQTFANESYIAMPAQVIGRNATALAACADVGIGVIAVDALEASILLRATRHHPVSPEWVRLICNSVGFLKTRRTGRTPHARRVGDPIQFGR